jgi:TolB protein
MKLLALTLALFAAASSFSFADDSPYIAVGTAKTKKTVIAFPAIKAGDPELQALAKKVSDIVASDLSFMDLFSFVDSSAFIEKPDAGITLDRFKLSDWTTIGAEFLLKSSLTREGDNLVLETYLYNTFGAKQVLGKRYVSTPSDLRVLSHTLANNVVEALTGLPGIFLTKIAMSCDRSSKKEIYMMDFDGTNVKQLTKHRSIAFAPAWSPDSTRLAYSVYTRHKNNLKNIDLYEFNFLDNSYRMISNRKGINSGAAYSPDGSKIALTMSFLGNPEIFTFDPKTDSVTRLTKSFGFDVDPSWSPDGKDIAFVSSRAGLPMVYTMKADGSEVHRLTYAGKYNATPSWSPQNNKIAFAGWLDKHFDIFIMNPDGSNIQRLSKNQGNNEDPSFSPDGNFIVFSSNRTGQQNIYVVNVDGTFAKRLTFGLGNCVAPKWSNPPRATH